MKVVIYAGGFGTRIGDDNVNMPKPLIEIGGMPILWHIMKHYLHYGHKEFIIACGYKAQMIKQFFVDYALYSKDLTINCKDNHITMSNNLAEDWSVTLIDTGLSTCTGTRLQKLRPYLGDEPFMLTYGDGVANVDLDALIAFHRQHGKSLTVSAIHPSERFGILDMNDHCEVVGFKEKIHDEHTWVNGGFFVCQPDVFDYIPEVSHERPEGYMWEQEPMTAIASAGQIMAFKHRGFWQCMDTLREKLYLNQLWDNGKAPWKCWN